MALSIKTEEADRLARELARIHGESLTEAVTVALRERLERDRVKPRTYEERLAAIEAAAANVRRHLTDLRPVTKEEWDEINDDTD
ncbi:MAG TPA: type II toxin-antitoxin system VapB family antitoxin [Caulobacteraceae bacterium]|jgi:antitoxin VapB|nr:type II toxin-antitoxin system VapB family antitoxin [Caulobacteraceae bacterium]